MIKSQQELRDSGSTTPSSPNPSQRAPMSADEPITRVKRALRWFHYISRGGVPLIASLASAVFLISGHIALNGWGLLLSALLVYLLYLYTAPIVRAPNEPVDEVLKLTLPLTWLSFFWVISGVATPFLSAITPFTALGVGVILSFTPRYLFPLLFLISACLELSFIVNAHLSTGMVVYHVVIHFLSVITLPRILSTQWAIRAFYPRILALEELPLSHRYFDSTRFAPSRRDLAEYMPHHTSHVGANSSANQTAAHLTHSSSSHQELHAKWDSTPLKINEVDIPPHRSQSRHGQPPFSDPLVHDLMGSIEPPMIKSAVTPLIENITGIVKSYSPIEGMPQLRDVLREHNQQAIEFINRSLDVHLHLLRQQLHVESAVLLWLRPKDHTLEIRAYDSMRDAFVYGSYSINQGILEAALRDPLRFDEPIEAHKIIPYYDRSVTLGGLLSTPVYLSSAEHADGILLVDRSSTDPWERHAHSTLKIIAEKISLDFETSQLLRKVTYDAGQVERLCYCLRKLNEAFGLEEVERCMVESIGVYHGFESASYFALQEGGELRLKSRWIHPQLLDTLGHTDQLIAVGNAINPGSYLLSRAAHEDTEFSTLLDPASPAEYLPHAEWTLSCASGVMAKPLRDPHNARVCGVLLLTVSSEEVIQPRRLAAFRLLVEQVEVKLSLVNAHERLKVMASIDWLTGLKNHMTFQSESSEMLKRAQRDQSALAFVLLDIDHFKSVNDNYGHPFGDLVLKRVAETLCQEVRDVDLVARYGGEEFALVLHATELDQALVSIDRVRRKVEALNFDFEDQLVRVTVSLGVACYPIDSRQQERLIDKADKALYQSKRNGRNQATAWRDIEPEERDSSVSWTRAPTHYIDEIIEGGSLDTGITQTHLDPQNQTYTRALSFELEELTPPPAQRDS